MVISCSMHPLVRSLPNLGAVVGQLLSTMLLARIVMLEVQARLSDGVSWRRHEQQESL